MRFFDNRMIVAGVLGLVAGWAWGLWEPRPTRLAILAVGQGDCALFQHEGANILIDAAPARDEWDAGERLALPELRRLGVDRIDLLIVTHPDGDHVGGLAGIGRALPIGALATARAFADRPETLQALRWVRGRRLLPLADGDRIEVGRARLDVAVADWGEEDNARSVMLRVSVGSSAAVLTGDAPVESEELAARRFGGMAAQVLKAGHHGSRGSTGERLLRAIRPAWVVLSVGRNNPYGHPSAETMRRVERSGARIWRTDRHGTAVFEATGAGFVPER
ncbi:MAG: MBL fold metallo-hydrolase [Fimbriimonadales bacterium]|nr:MBL fold metallo-hydrolase [Fimbriimonadales bacterium]